MEVPYIPDRDNVKVKSTLRMLLIVYQAAGHGRVQAEASKTTMHAP